MNNAVNTNINTLTTTALLKPQVTNHQIKELANEASVVVPPANTPENNLLFYKAQPLDLNSLLKNNYVADQNDALA